MTNKLCFNGLRYDLACKVLDYLTAYYSEDNYLNSKFSCFTYFATCRFACNINLLTINVRLQEKL